MLSESDLKQGLNESEFTKAYLDFLKQLHIYLLHFPKHEKYALSNNIKQKAYLVWDLSTEARKRYHKKTTLSNLDLAFEGLKMNLFLAFKLGYFSFKDGKTGATPAELAVHRYAVLESKASLIGKMIGAWLKLEALKA